MKYIIIDDHSSFAAALCNKLNPVEHSGCVFSSPSSNNFEKYIQSLKDAVGEEDVLFINANLKTGENTRHIQKGIELLIWLRIKDVMNHVVLYSFETVHNILQRKPEHLILTSKGTSFVQLPNDFKYMQEVLTKKKDDKNLLANKEAVKKTLRSVFSNSNLKHRLANIYGLWFMFNTHNKYFSSERLKSDFFSEEFLQGFNAQELSIANFLSETSNKKISDELIKNITRIKTTIREKNPKILYIDDKAEIGWAGFLKKIIYGNGNTTSFQVHSPVKEDFESDDKFDTLFEQIKIKILNNKNFIDFLLLDLRLADEEGDIDLDNLSGIRLLKKIHQSFPSLPVIMFTASGKASSVKKIIECGAEGLWTKPGLDELKDDLYYLTAYHELLIYINEALNKYKTLTEKYIINAQFQIESINKSISYPLQLNDIDVILTDTTFWCNTKVDLVNNHKSARKLLNLEKRLKRKSFIVIDDVIQELFLHTQKKDEGIHSIGLKQSAYYGLNVIQKYKDETYIGTGYEDINKAIKESITYQKEKAKGSGFHIISNVRKVHSYHTSEDTANNELEKRKQEGYNSLHADDTFQMLVAYYLTEKKNILFITDDFKTNIPNIIKTIGFKFDTNGQVWKIPTGFKKEEDILKVNADGKYCLIVHSKVLNKICFSQDGKTINIVEPQKTTVNK
jgi:CheY-like chemotaxis protein